MKKWSILLSICLFSGSLFGAHGWHSGGAKVFDRATNPWFVNNKVVTYCFVIDEENFGVSLVEAQQSFARATQYWVQQFKSSMVTNESERRNFTFQQEPCSQSTDIHVQLGVLSQRQQDYIENVNDTIACSVRTDSSLIDFSGKGFLYVSPEFGEHSLPGSWISSRWSRNNGAILDKVFMHELGHILGFQHSNQFDIMNLELIKKIVGVYASGYRFPSIYSKIVKNSDVLSVKKFDYFFGATEAGEVVLLLQDFHLKGLNELFAIGDAPYIKLSWNKLNFSVSVSFDNTKWEKMLIFTDGVESLSSVPISFLSHDHLRSPYAFQLEERYSKILRFENLVINIDFDGMTLVGQNEDTGKLVQTLKTFFHASI